MKKIGLIFLLILGACAIDDTEIDSPVDPAAEYWINFNNTGVDMTLEAMRGTRTEICDSFLLTAEDGNGFVFEGVIDVEVDTQARRIVSLYETADYLPDDIFLGAYIVDDNNKIIEVLVGEESVGPMAMQPGETYRQCVKREYLAMKKAYEERPLDDIACTVLGGGLVCKTLALVAAAYECGK